ncbi:uncharacterized protein LODBEIA_P49350 [Lodderomyces beijingensis]|uniref:BBC1/AIM3 cysteine proteinase-fold domain-containing protein n=1 Tax=Lodderomyces beijingensis TaxID=1775926 RepID=A0ABP0ZUQ4_9ASCO
MADQLKTIGAAAFRGSKSLSKKGYSYYKDRTGEPSKSHDGPEPTETAEYRFKPLPSKDKLQSFPEPPKRNVQTHQISKPGEASKYAPPSQQSVPQPQQPQQQAYQPQYQNQPVESVPAVGNAPPPALPTRKPLSNQPTTMPPTSQGGSFPEPHVNAPPPYDSGVSSTASATYDYGAAVDANHHSQTAAIPHLPPRRPTAATPASQTNPSPSQGAIPNLPPRRSHPGTPSTETTIQQPNLPARRPTVQPAQADPPPPHISSVNSSYSYSSPSAATSSSSLGIPIAKPAPPKPAKRPDVERNSSANSQISELESIFKKKFNTSPSEAPQGKKKPPPPVVKAKPAALVASAGTFHNTNQNQPAQSPASSQPAAIPSRTNLEEAGPAQSQGPKPAYSRSRAPLPPASRPGPPQLDLDLGSGWFSSQGPLQLPPSLQGLNYQTSTSISSSLNNTRILTLRLQDLSILSYKFEWHTNRPQDARVSIEKYVESPLQVPVTKEYLVAQNQKFGEYVASWCEHNQGKQVGSGECWDLAKFALEKGCGKHAFVSQYYIHGYPIYKLGNGNASAPLDDVRRGDILQFRECKFVSPNGVTQTVGMPDHTSVVVDSYNGTLTVLEQNVNGVRKVVQGSYVLASLKSGQVTVFRAMPAEWAGDL